MPTPIIPDPDALRFDDASTTLLGLLLDDLDRGADPVPTLLAFAGDRALGFVGLRPFTEGELPQALIEVLALLLPLGADRLAFGACGRVWSTADPIVPVCDDGDLRQRAITITIADGHATPSPTLSGSVHPFHVEAGELTLLPPVDAPATSAADEAPAGSLPVLLSAAVSRGADLTDLAGPSDLVAQLGRVMLLGHQLMLAPEPAAHLTAASGR